MRVGNKILDLRKRENYTQEELAEKMDVTRQTISKWELGETSPNLDEAIKLSKIFKISLDELVGNDFENIIIDKISNTEYLAGMIIKILKTFGIILLVVIITSILVVATLKYYEVKPNNMVADSVGVYCTIDGEKQYFEATTTRDNPNIDLHSTDEEMLKEINLDLSKFFKLVCQIVVTFIPSFSKPTCNA